MTSLYVALKPILRGEVLTTCYANHRMRWASSYIESVDAQAKRNILIERIKEKSLSSSRLTIEEGFIARWVVVTPQLLFRWLKNKEVEGESLRHLFIKVRDNFSDEPGVDRYIECMIAFFRLPEGLRELIIRNWLDVALSFDETRGENKEITFYCLFRVLEYVFKNMEEEFLRKNRALIEWEDPLNKTLGIKLGVIKL